MDVALLASCWDAGSNVWGGGMAVAGTARWPWIWPALAWTILLITPLLAGGGFMYAVAGVALFGTVFAAVYHAEMVAHRVGEPFGTLILALAVTVIETALIVSVMIAAPAENVGLARDTVFAAVMIVCNGIVGACLLWGGVRHHEQGFQAPGSDRSPGGPGCADRSHHGSSEPCGPGTRPVVQQAAAHLRRFCVAGALFRIRLHPDGTPSRLFPAGQEFEPGGARPLRTTERLP